MRDLSKLKGIKYYIVALNERNAAFVVASPIDGGDLRCIASVGGGWDHVSVSRVKRCPNWPEMAHIKSLCWEPEEAVMQLHVPESEHINCHAYCLHLWRPHGIEIPKPPDWMVGVKE